MGTDRARIETAAQIVALAVIAFVFATNVYRAATQSITCDEAHMFQLYVDPPLDEMFKGYDAANHVLYTLAARYMKRWFGLSEFTLRLPSLVGGLLYLLTAFQLSRRLFGRRWLFLLAVSALVLNPFLLDYFSVARGYGLALGLFAWGLYFLARYVAEDYDRPVRLLPWAGLLFALCVASNLVFVIPVAATGAVFTAYAGRQAIDQLWGPAVVPAFVLLVLPLANARPEHFYYGATTLFATADSIISVVLFHHRPTLTPYEHGWLMVVIRYVLPALTAAIAGAGAWFALKRRHSVFVLIAGGFFGSFAAVLALHALAGVKYPAGRTGIYFVFLLTLGCAGLIAQTWNTRVGRWLIAVPCAVLLCAALARFSISYTAGYYSEWRYDAGTKRIMAQLADRANGRASRLIVSGMMQPSVRFYRRMWRMNWIAAELAYPTEKAADYYILLPEDRGLLEKRALRPIYTDSVAGTVLAKPR